VELGREGSLAEYLSAFYGRSQLPGEPPSDPRPSTHPHLHITTYTHTGSLYNTQA